MAAATLHSVELCGVEALRRALVALVDHRFIRVQHAFEAKADLLDHAEVVGGTGPQGDAVARLAR